MNKIPDPVGDLPTADSPSPGVPPDKVALIDDKGSLQRPADGGPQALINFEDLLREDYEAYRDFCGKLRKDPFVWGELSVRKEFLRLRRRRNQIDSMLLGYAPGMQRVAQPYNNAQLAPAVEAVCEAAPDLAESIPVALNGVNVGKLAFQRTWWLFLQDVDGEETSFQHAVSVLSSQTGQTLLGQVRQVWRRASGVISEFFDLNRRLIPLRTLVAGPAEQAKDTRNNLNKARDKAIAKAESGRPPTDGAESTGESPAPPPPAATPPRDPVANKAGKPAAPSPKKPGQN